MKDCELSQKSKEMLAPNPNEVISTETISMYTLKGMRHVWIRIIYYNREEVKELVWPDFDINELFEKKPC